MRIATKPLDYKIACYGGSRSVTGEALALPPPLDEFRFCVRYDARFRWWRIDHYDSGKSFDGPICSVLETRPVVLAYVRKWHWDGSSKEHAVAWLIRYLRHLLRRKAERIAVLRAAQGQ